MAITLWKWHFAFT